jgi:hypothetical protein
MNKSSTALLLTGTLMLASVMARAEEPPGAGGAGRPPAAARAEEGFGKAGVINIASDLSLSFQHTSFSAPSGRSPDSVTAYAIGPAADVFIIDNLSVGAEFLFGRTSLGPDLTENVLRIAPRVGYHISLVPERLGLWPRLEFGYESATIKNTGLPDVTEKRVVLGAFLPLLIHPVEHFHIGIGPFLDTDLSSKEDGQDGIKETTIGIRTEIAGWWHL